MNFVPLVHIRMGYEVNVSYTSLNFVTLNWPKRKMPVTISKSSFFFVSWFLPSFLHKPLCKLLKNCASTESLSPFLKCLPAFLYSLLLKLNKVHDGILQHDRKESFSSVYNKGILWTSLVCYIRCDREFCIVVEYYNIVYYHASFSAIPVWSLLGSELIKAFLYWNFEIKSLKENTWNYFSNWNWLSFFFFFSNCFPCIEIIRNF